MRVNMNHAATSGTKPRGVREAVTAYMEESGGQSAGRGGDEIAAMRIMLESRRALARFFGGTAANVAFTSGATESLNMAIFGMARERCHVLATSLEHNAAARPLWMLEQAGRIDVTWLHGGPDGSFDPQSVAKAVRPDTRMLVMTHASNVLGNILPVTETFAAAKSLGLITILDAAQSAGHILVALDENTDIIAFTGHKGLRGLAGSGGLILSENAAKEIAPWKAGGTGSHSQSLDMPDFLPDKLEPGTPNMLGIVSLRAAVEAIEAEGLAAVRAHEMSLIARFTDGLARLPVTIYGKRDPAAKTPVVSINADGHDPGLLARELGEMGIATRSGLHCSPLTHKTIGTFPYGTLRFSFGADTTFDDVDYVLGALKEVLAR